MVLSQSPARQIIAIDMDEVIADSLGEHLNRYNRDFSSATRPPVTREDLRGRRLWQVAPAELHPVLDNYFRDEDFFRVVPVMPDAQRVVARLQTRYEVFIASAAMEVPTSFAPKFAWLGEHFPFIPPSHIVFCGDKSILRADFLIDDNPRQLQSFRGEGIIYTSPANFYVSGYRRVDNWEAVEAMFLDATA
ncbi:MAG: 5' nucleotidase, NT5C type [Acidobacteriaceae bacterium]